MCVFLEVFWWKTAKIWGIGVPQTVSKIQESHQFKYGVPFKYFTKNVVSLMALLKDAKRRSDGD